jgi:cation transport ATPase
MSKKRSARKNQQQSASKNQQQSVAKNPQQPAAKNQPQPAKKTRSTLIAVVLVAVALHGLILSAVYFSVLGEAERTIGNWALMAMFATSAADIVAAVAMWFWKRWGMILYGVAAVVQAVIIVLASGDIFLLFGALLPAIIVLYILATKRDQFE